VPGDGEGNVTDDDQVRTRMIRPRQTTELTRAESWRLLASVSLGRIVFTRRAMPAIRPVNHLVDDQDIIIRSNLRAAIITHVGSWDEGVVVCYEADDLDLVQHTGWSVIATGMATLVRDPAVIARYEQALESWVEPEMDCVIAIRPQVITGMRVAAA
jgi:nitroimidazol reductase NimA-like FMN-containing flavoprotein (pyridoxamine 5'-phosphate oxidase superfamily)